MNRRNFLKSLAVVTAGAVVVPTVLADKNAEDPMLLALRRARDNTKYSRYCWRWFRGLPNYPPHSSDDFLDEVSFNQKFPLDSWYHASDGRFFRYAKADKNFIKNGRYVYANCPRCKRTDLHDHTRCPV